MYLRRAHWWRAASALLAGTALAFVGIAPASAGSSSQKNGSLDGEQVTFITGVTNSFSQCLITGLGKGFRGTGADLVTLEAQLSPEKQQSAIEDAIASQSAAGILLGLAPEVDASGIDAFAEADIPLVYIVNEVPDGSDPTAAISVDTGALTAAAVEALPEKLPKAKNIGIVNSIPGVGTDTEFLDAMESSVAELDGGQTIVGNEPGFFDEEGVATATETLLQAHPDMDVIFFLGETGVNGALRQLQAAGRDDVDVVVLGAFSDEAYDALADGTWAYAMAEPIGTIGLQAARAVKRIEAGKSVKSVTKKPLVIDKKNIKKAPTGCF